MTTSVQFRGVTKRFGSAEALSALDLKVEPGEFVSLLGPSGSGKSTTLGLLAGLIEADEGEILIGDRIVNDIGPEGRDIAMVFQNYALYPHMTVFENLAFPLRARGRRRPESEIESRIAAVAHALGLPDLLHRYPRELSGGQQQRVALGRAMIREPKVFLLDEPLSNLDARLRIRMRHDIKALHAAIGSTIIYVTHDQAEALSMSSRIAIFDKGKLQQYASPFEIYNRPANIFVANFVGERETLFLDGAIATDPALCFRCRDEALAIRPGATNLGAVAGRPLKLGLRTEAVELVPADAPAAFPVTVSQIELAGPDIIVYATTGTGIELCCRVPANRPIARGDRLHAALVPEALHLFDPETGAAIALPALENSQGRREPAAAAFAYKDAVQRTA
ncbi:ABC transporter ATP-binding protein [Chelatococcus asaccharovorans]|uniref:sn-glycerol 3-phosphate transport system ATP-binding protein/multiple sugar transport system ATP-binding protein n=1 Tax=Chelatococcus asaccharovorans TaxID=28210 RepID=A0A2V3UF42_9HYPH|nr:ABC transporter ATP-binding protein [Chelatococcus asaccharovorans]MBS7707316.1 ABC transporter ATP-binding protein [Chelatococcus asaccharovorans]PXW63498.1 sn-glycerol 3-phosphate transport system ATP-binding protein/multiple sugar transport system ATP-binding protein [Chelatococcus asaccharovorans]